MAHYFIANHDKRFVAIASPKCASTAVRSWFLQTAGLPPVPLRGVDPYLVAPKRIPALGTYARVLFVRDPLCRLVGFYWNFVVCDPRSWCFLDDRGEVPLQGATFRAVIEAVNRARHDGVVLQHHLLAQSMNLPADRAPDHLALVERLDDELTALNHRFGLTGYHNPHRSDGEIDSTLTETVMDRRPDGFDRRRRPAFEMFYDTELAATARHCFPDDVALHASIPGARPLNV